MSFKGWLGEAVTQFGMWTALNGQVYRRVHNLLIPVDGGTTQIDHVLVSVYGVFVVETKNMDGWLFGDERASKWSQCRFRHKYQFQNPLHQNYRHTRALAEYLGRPHDIFHSVVFFIGECEFKTPLPDNVMSRGLSAYIRSFTRQILQPDEAGEIFSQIQHLKAHPAASSRQHVHNLQVRHNSDTCPKCGSVLILRTAKQGANAGNTFYGCTTFPRCRYTRPAD